jgi:hypothetical protein
MRLITFASRWKKELQPSSIQDGKNISKIISKEAKESGNKFLAKRLNDSSIARKQEIYSNAEEKFSGKQGKSSFKGFSERYKASSPKSSKTKKLINILSKNKGKLALLAGAGTLGTVGYKLYRKARSDKNKKRGKYTK